MSEFKVQELLVDLFNSAAYESDLEVGELANSELFCNCLVQTYEENGMLTNDLGVVIKTRNGEEFAITIQQRR